MSASGDRLDYSLVGLGGGEATESSGSPQNPSPQLLYLTLIQKVSFAAMGWMLFSLRVPLLVSFAVYSSAARRLFGGFTAIFALRLLMLSGPQYADQVFMPHFQLQHEDPQATLNSGGRHRLMQANLDQSQASELINKNALAKTVGLPGILLFGRFF